MRVGLDDNQRHDVSNETDDQDQRVDRENGPFDQQRIGEGALVERWTVIRAGREHARFYSSDEGLLIRRQLSTFVRFNYSSLVPCFSVVPRRVAFRFSNEEIGTDRYFIPTGRMTSASLTGMDRLSNSRDNQTEHQGEQSVNIEKHSSGVACDLHDVRGDAAGVRATFDADVALIAPVWTCISQFEISESSTFAKHSPQLFLHSQ